MPAVRLHHLRRYAAARTLGRPTTLARALARLRYVQADPIRAPARAQDLILRHRVTGYTAGTLERRYPRMAVEEDYLVNYGFVVREIVTLLHPRGARQLWTPEQQERVAEVRDFVARRRTAHPRQVQRAFDHGRVVNAWGGTSQAVSVLMEQMHRRGILRVARRSAGQRVYGMSRHAPSEWSADARADALLDVLVGVYAPLTVSGLGTLMRMLAHGVPFLQAAGALQRATARARDRLPGADVEGRRWLWPEGEDPTSRRWHPDDHLRVLAPFDPIVWDRARFALLWGWEYRFEAYTPAATRRFGYYAMPVLWNDAVTG